VLSISKAAVVIAAVFICAVVAVVGYCLMDNGNGDRIVYVTDGGTVPDDAPRDYVQGDILEIPDASRKGYVFLGWYLDSDRTVVFNGDTSGMTDRITLYAKWKADLSGHKLTFDISGTSRGGSTTSISGHFDYTYISYNVDKGHYYYTYNETTIYKDASGRERTETSSETDWEEDNNLQLTDRETISTFRGDVSCNVLSYKTSVYSMTQWVGEKDGILYKEEVMYSSVSMFSTTTTNITYTLTSDEIVEIEPTVVVTVVADRNITVSGNNSPYVPGVSVKLTAQLESGDEFRGWFDSEDELITTDRTLTMDLTESVTVYAKSKIWHNITYDLDGGSVKTELPTKFYEGEKLELPIAVHSELVFEYWSLDKDGETLFDGDTSDLTEDITLYAIWSENKSGNYVIMTKQGHFERGFNSYDLSGTITFTYLYYNPDKGSYFIRNSDYTHYDYVYIGQSYSESTSSMYWSSEIEGEWTSLGEETIIVNIDGVPVEKECSKITLTHPNGAVETQWIGDGWIPYKLTYIFDASTFLSDYRLEIEYLFLSVGTKEIESSCDVTVIAGDGITVTGNESPYKLGQTANLKVVMADGFTFSGWYDDNMSLLSTDLEYSFIVGGSQTLYALNSKPVDDSIASDTTVDLNTIFGLNNAEYTIVNNDTNDVDVYKGHSYRFDNGGPYTITAVDTDGTSKIFNVKVTGGAERTFTWKYSNVNYTFTMDIDYDDLLYSRSIYSESQRRESSDHVRDATFVTYSYTDAKMSPYMETLTEGLYKEFMKTHNSVSELTYLGYLLSFAQYIEYQTDEEYMGTTEYWKFPLETLYDQGGDCEDTSILFVALAHQSKDRVGTNYKTALQLLPGHAAGAVLLTSSSSYTKNPYGYSYCETTTPDFAIGEIPTKMNSYFTNRSYYDSNYSVCVEIS